MTTFHLLSTATDACMQLSCAGDSLAAAGVASSDCGLHLAAAKRDALLINFSCTLLPFYFTLYQRPVQVIDGIYFSLVGRFA